MHSMPPPTPKICGLSTPDTLDAAVRTGASHAGFVFFPRSPRHVEVGQAAALIRRLPDRVRGVAVVVDPDDALLDQIVYEVRPAVLQLHGVEDPGRSAAIRRRYGIEVWKAVPVRTRADLAQAVAFAEAADRLLYDAKTPDGSALPGGMGLRFDWRLLERVDHPLPWALSGGLDAENVGDAIRITGARLVDVSSGVESAPGTKDVDKITAFCQAVARS